MRVHSGSRREQPASLSDKILKIDFQRMWPRILKGLNWRIFYFLRALLSFARSPLRVSLFSFRSSRRPFCPEPHCFKVPACLFPLSRAFVAASPAALCDFPSLIGVKKHMGFGLLCEYFFHLPVHCQCLMHHVHSTLCLAVLLLYLFCVCGVASRLYRIYWKR